MNYLDILEQIASGNNRFPRKLRMGNRVITVLVTPARETTTASDIVAILRQRGTLSGRALQVALDGLLDAAHPPGRVRETLRDLIRAGVVSRSSRGYRLTTKKEG